MNTPRKVLAPLLALIVGSVLHAAGSKPIARVISVQEIETDDPAGYVAGIDRRNAIIKEKFGFDTYLHAYVTAFDGDRTNSVRVVSIADSVATLMKNAAAMDAEPALIENRAQQRRISKLGFRALYQCVRFDGIHPNASLYTTLALVTDERGYLRALDDLRAMLDQKGMKDFKVNVYRALAGRTTHTHRIAISAPSPERLATMLDWLATDPQLADWLASTAKFRAVVSNSTSRDATKTTTAPVPRG